MKYIQAADAFAFLKSLPNDSVDLFLVDPPYYGIVKDSWDNQWRSPEAYATWLASAFSIAKPKLKANGSLLFFGGIGKHGAHPLFQVMSLVEADGWTFRNMITWKKRRAYGKSHDYLFCREEILWYSRSAERTEVVFNVPLTSDLRGYKGFNPNYAAKSDYKRVSNVWTDIPELMAPKRNCQKPIELIQRLVETHSNEGQLVVDCFAGWGTTGMAALSLNRRFLGCEAIPEDAKAADERCVIASTCSYKDGKWIPNEEVK